MTWPELQSFPAPSSAVVELCLRQARILHLSGGPCSASLTIPLPNRQTRNCPPPAAVPVYDLSNNRSTSSCACRPLQRTAPRLSNPCVNWHLIALSVSRNSEALVAMRFLARAVTDVWNMENVYWRIDYVALPCHQQLSPVHHRFSK